MGNEESVLRATEDFMKMRDLDPDVQRQIHLQRLDATKRDLRRRGGEDTAATLLAQITHNFQALKREVKLLGTPVQTDGDNAGLGDPDDRGERMLSSSDREELVALLLEPKSSRDCTKCASICMNLRFFRRMDLEQAVELFKDADLLFKHTSNTVFKQGQASDGHMYVILSGSCTVQVLDPMYGGCPVVTSTLYDGHMFGDTQQRPSGDGLVPTRNASVHAQEDSFLLRISVSRYLDIFKRTVGQEAVDKINLLKKASFFRECSGPQLSSLAGHIEEISKQYGDKVVRAGERPPVMFILASGSCSVVIEPASAGVAPTIFSDLQPGQWFGSGAILGQGECEYQASLTIEVTSAMATFFVLTKKSLFFLPEPVQVHVLGILANEMDRCRPPPDEVVKRAKREEEWQAQRSQIVMEVLGRRDRRPRSAQQRRPSRLR